MLGLAQRRLSGQERRRDREENRRKQSSIRFPPKDTPSTSSRPPEHLEFSPEPENTDDEEMEAELDQNGEILPESHQKIRSKRMLIAKMVVNMPLDGFNYPRETCTPKSRNCLEIEKIANSTIANGKFNEETAMKCVFCGNGDATGENGDLIDCQGVLNQICRKISCKSKFHLKCVMNYHHSAFLFQYAARPECQNKLLCPLHCCSACNANHRKQTAYEGRLTECALCLKSFHTDTCFPVGCQPITVLIQLDDAEFPIPMIICPDHVKDSVNRPGKHIRVCITCKSGVKLVQCRKCVRSFHSECREVKMVDGKAVDKNLCDHCASRNVIRFNVPVIGRWSDRFYLAIPKPWSQYPKEMLRDQKFGRLGYAFVDYPLENATSIVAIRDLVQLVEPLLAIASSPEERIRWEETLAAFDEFSRFPPRYKEVGRTAKRSRHYDKSAIKLFKYHESEVCKCQGPARCSTESCSYVESAVECPPICNSKGEPCNNRKVSENRINPNLELREAGAKGYGVFATGRILQDEYIAEYVGEIITRIEKEQRLLSVQTSRDLEANHYMMDIANGFTVDAARLGNITRYMNHSCDPNAGSFVCMIYCKHESSEQRSMYDSRAYIKAIKDIEIGDEITFDYGMKSEAVPDCKCRSGKCTGRLSRKTEVKQEEEVEEELEQEVEVSVPARGIKRSRRSTAPSPEDARDQKLIQAQNRDWEGYPPKRRRIRGSFRAFGTVDSGDSEPPPVIEPMVPEAAPEGPEAPEEPMPLLEAEGVIPKVSRGSRWSCGSRGARNSEVSASESTSEGQKSQISRSGGRGSRESRKSNATASETASEAKIANHQCQNSEIQTTSASVAPEYPVLLNTRRSRSRAPRMYSGRSLDSPEPSSEAPDFARTSSGTETTSPEDIQELPNANEADFPITRRSRSLAALLLKSCLPPCPSTSSTAPRTPQVIATPVSRRSRSVANRSTRILRSATRESQGSQAPMIQRRSRSATRRSDSRSTIPTKLSSGVRVSKPRMHGTPSEVV